MPKITTKKNISIYYEEYGQGEPIVFIAGFSAAHSDWNAVAQICATKYRVIVFDNRGIGQSDCPDFPYTAELLADDTKELCDALGIKQAYFVGNSMGGFVVMMLAHRYPDLVKAVVISNANMKLENFFTGCRLFLEALLELMKLANMQKNLSDKINEICVKINLGWIFSNAFLNKPGIVDKLVRSNSENKYPMTEKGFINQINVSLTFDASQWLKEIKCPCLVVASDEDKVVPASEVEKVAQVISNAQYFLFTGVGHLPHVEQPDKFAEILFNFIAASLV